MLTISQNRFNVYQFFNDIILIGLSFLASSFFYKSIFKDYIQYFDFGILILLCSVWYLSSKKNHLYNELRYWTLSKKISKVAQNIAVQFLLIFFLIMIIDNHDYRNITIAIIYLGLISILIPLEKIAYKRFLLFLYKKGIHKRKILIVGAGQSGMEYFNYANQNKHLGGEVIGFLDDEKQPHLNGHYLGNLQHIDFFIEQQCPEIDEVVIALSSNQQHKIGEIESKISSQTMRLRTIPPSHSAFLDTTHNSGYFGNFPIFNYRNEPLEDIHLRFIKRLFDIIFSIGVILFVLSWLYPIIAILIRINSKGPVLFIQERWGRKNRKIKCYKFRTMIISSKDQDENGKYQQTTKNDSRITPIGKFLRKTSLDEFPQFINVLKGEMSIVGPRPHPTPLNIESKKVIDNYLVRHLVKPGITGWAQVNGYRGETKERSQMQARVECDIWYIENWSFLLDIKIIFMTIFNAVAGDENAF